MEVCLTMGLQASGKSTFVRERLSGHTLLSKDLWRKAKKPERRQQRLLREALGRGESVVVDNTHPDAEARASVLAIARELGATVVGYWFPADVEASKARNAVRPDETRVPDVGLFATLKRLRAPTRAEGFDQLYAVRARDGRFDVEPM
jgi:predicted kinase